MRFFIALEIPEENKQELLEVQNLIKQVIPEVKLTSNSNLHLTIAFIGEQEESFKDSLIEVIKKAAFEIPPFEVTPAYLDGFPHMHTAKILWIGIKGDTDKLYLLRHRIKDGLISLNLDVDERRYTPHIAVGKVKDFKLKDFQEKRLQEIMSENFSPIKVSSVKLFESIPKHGFHTHSTLSEIPLI